MFLNYSGIQLEISKKKKKKEIWETQNYPEIKQHTLNNQWIKEKVKGEIIKYFEMIRNMPKLV